MESSDSLFNTEFASWTMISSKSGSWLKYSKLDAICHKHLSSNRPILNKRAKIQFYITVIAEIGFYLSEANPRHCDFVNN